MRVADVLDRIETSNPRRRGEYFEAFVQNLLKQHFERIGKTYVPQFRDGGLMLDGYVTDGIEDVDGPVGFEIMYVRYATPSIMISQRLLKIICIGKIRSQEMGCSSALYARECEEKDTCKHLAICDDLGRKETERTYL